MLLILLLILQPGVAAQKDQEQEQDQEQEWDAFSPVDHQYIRAIIRPPFLGCRA
jgi:hypothetical protein